MSTETLTLTRPDDWHLHLRDGEMLEQVVPDTARCFHRAIVMPNLKPPVTTVAAAGEYRQRILDALPEGMKFEPLMTLYLTDNTSPDEIRRAAESDFVHAVKYYPAGATTNSDSGVTDLKHARPALEAMQEFDLPLLLHGEVTDPDIDIFDREAVFIDRHLQPLVRDFPELRMVLEHVTTRDAVDFVAGAPDRVAATITVHHLLLNRNAMFVGGLRRTITACRSSSARNIAGRWCGRPPAATRSSSWARIRRRIRAAPRSRIAAAQGSTARRSRWSSTPRCSTRPMRWLDWKALPACTARSSTDCRQTGERSR